MMLPLCLVGKVKMLNCIGLCSNIQYLETRIDEYVAKENRFAVRDGYFG